MKSNLKINITIPLFITIIFLLNANIFADTLKLVDGSAIQGKIIVEDDKIYLFSNTYGTFEIRKQHIAKLFITNSYKEDIEIIKKHNLKIDLNLVKSNYEAGLRKKSIMGNTRRTKTKKYFEYWDYGRLSISAAYFATISAKTTGNRTVNEKLPSGFSGHLAYEQGLDMLLSISSKTKSKKEDAKTNSLKKMKGNRKFIKTKPRPMGMPGLRIEWSWLYFTKDLFVNDEKEISGSMLTAGPIWSFPSPHNVWGCFILAAMPGASFIRVKNRETSKEGDDYTFGLTCIFGYEYAIKEKVALLFHARYTYIANQDVDFHGIGASFGISCRLW